jgi:uncharacterized membrane protein YeaQ/YmgE (transglycosylase-associated protein family)
MLLEALVVAVIVGALAGWSAGQLAQGSGFGLIADIGIGVVGAMIDVWLLLEVGVPVGGYTAAAISAALIGAALSLGLFRLAHRHRRLL